VVHEARGGPNERRRFTLVFDYRFDEDSDNNLGAMEPASPVRFVQPLSNAQLGRVGADRRLGRQYAENMRVLAAWERVITR
jgi:hypothetical protein